MPPHFRQLVRSCLHSFCSRKWIFLWQRLQGIKAAEEGWQAAGFAFAWGGCYRLESVSLPCVGAWGGSWALQGLLLAREGVGLRCSMERGSKQGRDSPVLTPQCPHGFNSLLHPQCLHLLHLTGLSSLSAGNPQCQPDWPLQPSLPISHPRICSEFCLWCWAASALLLSQPAALPSSCPSSLPPPPLDCPHLIWDQHWIKLSQCFWAAFN